MRATNPQRRRVQYSLRSLMLLILAASLLLGYEVPPARRVERASVAIRAAGGGVEFETRFSLFKYVLGGSYGQRIVKASIPGRSVPELTPWLESLGDLRAV